MTKNDAIGFFDSGLGGLSIWQEVTKLLPNENTIYLADSINAPYGPKGQEKIIHLSARNTEFLIKKGCKVIVVACNTATTNAIEYLRKNYPVKFIGIEPAIKPAALQSKTNIIGILATKGTLSSSLFHETSSKFLNEVTLIEQIGEGLVPLIETGNINSIELKKLLEKYLTPMVSKNIDHLVLGCSHYPFLIPLIKEILPNSVHIIDSGYAVARQTRRILKKEDLLQDSNRIGTHQIFTSGSLKILMNFTNKLEVKSELFPISF